MPLKPASIFLAGLTVFFLLSCTPAQKAAREPVPEPKTLHQLLWRAREAQSLTIPQLYRKPEQPGGYMLVARAPARLDLVQGVTAFSGDETGLAVGKENGMLALFAGAGCPGLHPPLPGMVDILAWSPPSPYLAASHSGDRLIRVYDVEACSQAMEHQLHAPPVAMAVSLQGDQLAVADDQNRLWAGHPTGSLKRIADLPGPVLSVGFGPGQGVLMAACRGGQVFIYNMRDHTLLDSLELEGGPYAKARFSGEYLVVETSCGSRRALDVSARKLVPYSRTLARYSLENGVLRYETWNPHLFTRPFEGEPTFEVDHSPSSGTIRVRDLDGAIRYYDQFTGLERECFPVMDWLEVPTNEKGNFCVEGRCYILTDRAYQKDHDRLLCRHVPGVGYFLWWDEANIPAEFNPLPGHLPARVSILAEQVADWMPVNPPGDFQ